jgi:hypothetical protein
VADETPRTYAARTGAAAMTGVHEEATALLATRSTAAAPANQPDRNGWSSRDEMVPAGARGDDLPARDTMRALASDVEAGIARIATHQLQQVAAAERGDFFVQLELPYRGPDGVDTLRVELEGREHSTAVAEEPPLELRLCLPLPPLGEFRAQLSFRGEHLAVTLWSDEPSLRALMLERVADLEGSLTGAGFELAPVGLRRLESSERLRGLPSGLVDARV